MIKSMTGFASLTHEDDRATVGVTIRAVNHRYLDVQLRIPQLLGDLEPRVRALLQKRLARGRVELAITVQLRQINVPTVERALPPARCCCTATAGGRFSTRSTVGLGKAFKYCRA